MHGKQSDDLIFQTALHRQDDVSASRPLSTSGDERAAKDGIFAQMRGPSETRAWAARLCGTHLPDIELESVQRGPISLRGHTRGVAVIYLLPGEEDAPTSAVHPTRDNYQHQAYAKHTEEFHAFGATVIAISRQSKRALLQVLSNFRCGHLLVSDPDLKLAHAMGLPITKEDDKQLYRRLTLITHDGLVLKAFLPISPIDSARDASRVLAWLALHGRER